MIKESSMGSASERNPKSSQRYLKFGSEKGIGKIVFRAKAQSMSSEVEGAAKVTGQDQSSRANARDLRKISPGVYPELGRRGRNDKGLSLRACRLGAITFFVTTVGSRKMLQIKCSDFRVCRI